MQTKITSNCRPLLRAFYAFLIAIAALWAIADNARAQLYITNRPVEFSGPYVVSQYNAETGVVINANFITGVTQAEGLALQDNILFVADLGAGTVGKYDANTGGVINASFIMELNGPVGLALLDNTLFVTNFYSGAVGAYDATTGAAINATLITNLSRPEGLAILPNVPLLPSALFVANSGAKFGTGSVGKYDATSGAPIKPDFIKRLNFPSGLLLVGNTLFVTSQTDGTVSEYSAITGEVIRHRFITGLSDPVELALKDNTLFVVNNSGTVGTYNATTGKPIHPTFITGLNFPVGIAVR